MKQHTFLALALAGSLAAAPAHAFDGGGSSQGFHKAADALTTTQSPPAGNSSQSMPEPANSLPPQAGTEKPTTPTGTELGVRTTERPDTADAPKTRVLRR